MSLLLLAPVFEWHQNGRRSGSGQIGSTPSPQQVSALPSPKNDPVQPGNLEANLREQVARIGRRHRQCDQTGSEHPRLPSLVRVL